MSARVQEAWEHSRSTTRTPGPTTDATSSSPDDFPLNGLAEEQMRGLVARVFLGAHEHAARHVIVGALDGETRSWELCTQLGLALARETAGTVLLGRGNSGAIPAGNARSSVREHCLRLGPNIWMLADSNDSAGQRMLASHTDAFLQQVHREFDFSVMHVVWSRLLSEGARMARMTDGLLLAIGQNTRRAAAQSMRESLANAGVRLIGAVMTGRTFPVPEGVYRRL